MNPFTRGRFEYIPENLYHLPPELMNKLEDSKPCYVIGSRGSGKTTLLKSLDWKERHQNQSLRRALDGDPFRGEFIGVYVKLPLVQVSSMREWLSCETDATHDTVFSHYLDLISAESIAYAFSKLLSLLLIEIDPEIERKCIEKLVEEQNDILQSDLSVSICSVKSCHKAIRMQRRKLEKFAVARYAVSDCIGEINFSSPGGFVRDVCSAFSTLLPNKYGDQNKHEWYFKCCFDEAECLDKRQLKVINSIVRTSSWPVSYVISFVGQPDDLSLTVHEKLTVQQADRSMIHLDSMDRNQFEKLCDGVANLRIQASLTESSDPRSNTLFSTSRLLGDKDLNEIVAELLNETESENKKNQFNIMLEDYQRKNKISSCQIGTLPYIEAYLFRKLGLDPVDSGSTTKKRAQGSREYRKKFVGGFLSICQELKLSKLPYAYSKMVFGLSYGCIRDYLAIMRNIYEENRLEVHIDKIVPWKKQSKAIHRTSLEKLDSIRTGDNVSNPERVRRITVAFGYLTGILHRGKLNKTFHLRSPERGLFNIGHPITEIGSESNIYEILRDASEAGFIKLKMDGKRIRNFQIHSSLAPVFGFSYRGSYYEARITKEQILDVLNCEEEEDIRSQAETMAKHILKSGTSENQLSLFPGEDSES